MPGSKEILNRISSIQDTMKITNAMYLISSSKYKKARKSLNDSLPFFENLQYSIAEMLEYLPEKRHEFFEHDKKTSDFDKKRGYIVITGDKGLCGAYNHNVFKLLEEELKKGKNNILFSIGESGRRYFERKQYSIAKEFRYTAQDPNIHRAREISREIVELFLNKEIDEVYIIFTKMISAIKEETTINQLLPLKRGNFETEKDFVNTHVAEFVPSAGSVISAIVPNYIMGMVFGAMIESYSSEQNSRMTAMDSSTKNAKDMLKELKTIYNRARQASITQEITEIVGGANALKNKK